VNLIDRFLDDNVHYPLEWDDFISWENANPFVEKVRNNIGRHEALLFSKNARDRKEYRQILVEERNRVAAIIGVAPR
jgi:hypothetical protein